MQGSLMPVIGLDVRPIETERDAECRVELSDGAGDINPSAGEMATDDGQPLPLGEISDLFDIRLICAVGGTIVISRQVSALPRRRLFPMIHVRQSRGVFPRSHNNAYGQNLPVRSRADALHLAGMPALAIGQRDNILFRIRHDWIPSQRVNISN